MIDHLLKAATEADMIAAVGSYINLHHAETADTPAGWRGDICFPCQVLDATGTPLPYFYLWVALPEEDATLAAMPECVIVADRDASQRGEPFVLWATLPATDLDTYTVSPVIMGSQYPFGSV